MQGHHTREDAKTTEATEQRLLQVFKRDKELSAALGYSNANSAFQSKKL